MNNNYKKKPNRFFNKDKNNDKEDRIVYRTKNENKNVLALWQKKLMVISRSLSMDFENSFKISIICSLFNVFVF